MQKVKLLKLSSQRKEPHMSAFRKRTMRRWTLFVLNDDEHFLYPQLNIILIQWKTFIN